MDSHGRGALTSSEDWRLAESLVKITGVPKDFFIDTPELPAATILALTSGRYDWLRGRCVTGHAERKDGH